MNFLLFWIRFFYSSICREFTVISIEVLCSVSDLSWQHCSLVKSVKSLQVYVLPISQEELSSDCNCSDFSIQEAISKISLKSNFIKFLVFFSSFVLSCVTFFHLWPVSHMKTIILSRQHFDLINPEGECLVPNEYDLCHDKGTYDAISLCPDDPSTKMAAYVKAVHTITHQNGIFLITSCNWTQQELEDQFSECKLHVA